LIIEQRQLRRRGIHNDFELMQGIDAYLPVEEPAGRLTRGAP
jgi:hypothetical protein